MEVFGYSQDALTFVANLLGIWIAASSQYAHSEMKQHMVGPIFADH